MKTKYSGFTLAEVLITLGIIGIVAAMTLPSVINNSRNKQLEAGLKKAYSVIGQALDMYQAETGERITQDTVSVKKLLIKYIKTARDCGNGSESSEAELEKVCIPNYVNTGSTEKNSTKYKTFNGKTNITLGYFDDGQFVMLDGSLVLLENRVYNNKENVLYISVDVNGYNKNPNRLGQDLFMFQVDKKGKLLPMGADGTTYYSTTDEYCSAISSTNINGAGCTYNALTDKDFFKNLPK